MDSLGAGKSSLINLLIDLTTNADTRPVDFMATPVIGRSASNMPTSADVHLYVDPKSCYGARPILYADCEGLEGGERDPVATQAQNIPSSAPSVDGQRRTGASKALRKVARATMRHIRWAKRDSDSYEQTSKRGYAVAEMFPRIFYAFSDVIVFVLNNPK